MCVCVYLNKLEEDQEVGVDLQLSPVLGNHVHDLLHHLRMTTGVDRQTRGGREVRVLFQRHRLVQVILWGCEG